MEFPCTGRIPAPTMPSGTVRLRRPPEVPASPPTNPLARLLPMVMLVAAGGMVILYLTGGPGLSSTRSPMYLFFPLMMLVSVLGTVANGVRGRSGELDVARRGYLRYLDTIHADLEHTADAQRRSLHWTHPPPSALWALAGGPRMWERRRADPDFGRIRVGLAPAALATQVVIADGDPTGEPDPVTETALDDLLAAGAVVPALPDTVALTGSIGIIGDPESARDLVRAMVCQLATLHSPADITIAARVRPGERHWDWLKWLPHHGADHCGARTVLIVDDDGPVPDGTPLAVLIIGGTGERTLEVGPDSDALTAAQAQMCARRLARWSTGGAAGSGHSPDWSRLIGDTGADLRVPIGVDDHGAPVLLDIKEAAHGGMGPHGLCIGATGSGKSEFLRTLVLGMAATHPSDRLNLALIDFKGGATFLGFEKLQHVAAVITNLAEEAYLVDRMREALTGEIHRRQQLLRVAGVGGIAEYRGTDLPVLFIVIDEFSELLSRHPDFAELFLAVGRLGRSLGMHLLLASQRLDEGRLRGLETHLSYRICLKTFSAGESRAVLGVPDAHELPAEPGAAYLKTADGALVRFRTAFVSGPADPPPQTHSTVRLFTAGADGADTATAAPSTGTVLSRFLHRLAGHGPRAHRIWLPPLSAPPSLAALLERHDGSRLCTPVGLVDNAFAQRRDLHTVDLTGAGGHVAVVGATRSGKSTLLCTLLMGLAAQHSPAEVQFYCLDFGGGMLSALREVPHVGVVAGRDDHELIRRTIAHVQGVITRRQGRRADDHGEVVLVLDGWAALRQHGDGLDDAVTEIAAHGLAHGVHVIISASRWAELRPALKDQLGSRIELRLGEPGESEMDRRAARLLSDQPSGTALTRDGSLSVLALPATDTTTIEALRARHPDVVAPPVRLLPARLDRRTLPASAPGCTVVVGIAETDLGLATVDFAESGHLIVLGDSGCGKTATLRTLCAQLVQANPPEAVQLYLADPRRTLLGVVDTGHLAGYAISATILADQLPALVEILRARMPGAAVTQQQLRDRSWWVGPEIFVIIDDYELLSGTTDPLTMLLEFLPYARDVGLHVVLARRAGGAARALFNPVPATLRELGAAGLMMSAGAEEGVLLGAARPSRMPPGRAILSRRGHTDQRIQIAWTEPP